MNTALTAVILFTGLVGVVLLGRRVRRYLPEDHLSAVVFLDRLLAVYGPEAAGARGEFRDVIASAFSVACAVLLILELDHPFGGLIRIPSEPMINVLNHLAK
jgi:hypothetical protein